MDQVSNLEPEIGKRMREPTKGKSHESYILRKRMIKPDKMTCYDGNNMGAKGGGGGLLSLPGFCFSLMI